MYKVKDVEEFVSTCESAGSMAEAPSKLGMNFNTFTRVAKSLGCYHPNQGRKGCYKLGKIKIETRSILEGHQPQFQTFKLRNRLIKEGLNKNECEICGLKNWLGKGIQVELHHINGNRVDHRFENLQMICPNCHSQTMNFRAKNIKAKS